jgi:hypothetical protein
MNKEPETNAANDPFSEEEDRLAQIEAALIETDWEDAAAAHQPAEAARDAYKWLLKRYRRTLRLADRMESRLKSSLDKEAEQTRGLGKRERKDPRCSGRTGAGREARGARGHGRGHRP